jgi:hypothetical protein
LFWPFHPPAFHSSENLVVPAILLGHWVDYAIWMIRLLGAIENVREFF